MNNLTMTKTPPPMRGIKQAVEEIKAIDPNTVLTEGMLRRMVLSGELPHVKAGHQYLINLNILYQYLNNGTAAELPPIGKLRMIKE